MDKGSFGDCNALRLRHLAESEQEHAAIERLADFCASAGDVRTIAAIFDRVGEPGNARDLERRVLGEVSACPCVLCDDRGRLADGSPCTTGKAAP